MMTGILYQIEKERQQLHKLQSLFGMRDECVLIQSMRLDELINQYYKVKGLEQS